ncbi:MAG TPA: 23S rRNA (cytidine(2498)-2'-O)-methyltransferase RlmM [Myxococcota bacterium]|nr:23S rRNA (cytidine(2498)-2'-O)-methyltransferase RlmM [Myxococcota bacterium]
MKPSRLLFYCRAGFEKECAQEVAALAGAMGVDGFFKARPGSGFAVFQAHQDAMGAELGERLEYARLVFPRQMVRATGLVALAEGDRVTPIAIAARTLGSAFRELWIEMPDTNEGKSLATLTRPLRAHLEKGLARAGVRIDDAGARERLHVFFVGGLACHVGVSEPGNASAWPMGIPRLRSAAAAPSRSAPKLAEALMEFVDGGARHSPRITPGMTAVDLGASPGGWSWQLARRGFMVTAVDRGPMDAKLLDSGQVKHRREDGFHYRPPEPVDWMTCDMVESPSRIAALVARWIASGWCRESIFNLKLPMKRRWEEVERCRAIIDEALGGAGYFLRMKHLYHDREEVTGYLSRRPTQSQPPPRNHEPANRHQ